MSLDERLRAYRDGLERAINEQADSDTHTAEASAVRPRDRSRVVVAVAIVAVVAMVSSAIVGLVHHFDASTNGPLTIDAIASNTFGQTARIASTDGFTDDQSPKQPSELASTGVFDFDRNLARVEIPAGHGLKDDGRSVVLFVRGTMYFPLNSEFAPQIPERARRDKHWIGIVENANTFGALGTPNPFTTLADLRSHASSLTDLGVTHADGQVVHHYHAINQEPVSRSTPTTSGTAKTVKIGYDLYVDGHQRLVRLVIREPENDSPQVRLDFSDYGVPVNVVAPPAAEVIDLADLSLGFTAPHLTAPWSRVASGATGGYTWTLYRAPADHERACWSFEARPALANSISGLLNEAVPGFEKSAPIEHDGHDAVCSRTGVWASPLQFVFDGQPVPGPELGARTVAVVIVDDEVASVDANPPGGSVTPIVIDRNFGGFVDLASYGAYTLHLHDGRTIACRRSSSVVINSNSAPTCPLLAG